MKTHQIERRDLTACTTAVVRAHLEVGEIGRFVGRAIGAVAAVLAGQRARPLGPPFARYHRVGPQEFDVEVGFITTTRVSPAGEVVESALPGGTAAVMTYLGPYEDMEGAYGALAEWVAHNGGEPTGDPWEVYFSDPATEPDPQRWRTEIVMPFAGPVGLRDSAGPTDHGGSGSCTGDVREGSPSGQGRDGLGRG